MDPWILANASNYDAIVVEIAGRNPDLDTATVPETLWDPGGLYVWQTAAETLELVSSSGADAAAGTGARTVSVQGLSAAGILQEEIATLNGVTAVPLALSYLRVNKAQVATVGSGGFNAGTVTLRRTSAGVARAQIPVIGGVGLGVGMSGRYTVPAGHDLIITTFQVTLEGDAAGDKLLLGVFARVSATAPWLAAYITGGAALGNSSFPIDLSQGYVKFAAGTDIEFKALSCTANNMAAAIRLRGFLLAR